MLPIETICESYRVARCESIDHAWVKFMANPKVTKTEGT